MVKTVLPEWASGTPYLIMPSQFDCSDLAAKFLVVSGMFPLPYSFYEDSARISPNDIYRELSDYVVYP